MKKFRFRLQVLLDQRKAKEDQLLGELGEVRREEALEIERLDELNHTLHQAWKAAEEALCAAIIPEEITRRDEYVKAVRDDIKVQELTLEAVQKRVEKKRIEVVEAVKERKVLESLRDKQEREYLLAYAHAEQNSLDEMASLRYARGM